MERKGGRRDHVSIIYDLYLHFHVTKPPPGNLKGIDDIIQASSNG
jgi:hypothetical protein